MSRLTSAWRWLIGFQRKPKQSFKFPLEGAIRRKCKNLYCFSGRHRFLIICRHVLDEIFYGAFRAAMCSTQFVRPVVAPTARISWPPTPRRSRENTGRAHRRIAGVHEFAARGRSLQFGAIPRNGRCPWSRGRLVSPVSAQKNSLQEAGRLWTAFCNRRRRECFK